MVKQGVLAVNPWEEAPGLDPGAVHQFTPMRELDSWTRSYEGN